jgi:chemotaxis protein CheC
VSAKTMSHILVVDDSRIARAVIRQILERAGHQVTEAPGVTAALTQIAQHAPDCVTSDMLMPDGGGRGLMEALHQRGLDVPVVVVTADIQSTTRDECMRTGAAAVVDKPVRAEELLRAVSAALAGRTRRTTSVLTPERMADLAEVVNLGVGRAAAALNDLIGGHVELSVPFAHVLTVDEVARTLGELALSPVSSVQMEFQGSLDGSAFLIFPQSSATKLVAAVTGEQPRFENLDSIRSGTLTEVGNILISSAMGTLSNTLHKPLRYSLPVYAEAPIVQILAEQSKESPLIVLAKTNFLVRQMQIEGNLLLLFELKSFDDLLAALEADPQGP